MRLDHPDVKRTAVVVLRAVGQGTEMTFTRPRHEFSDEHLERTRAGDEGFFDAMDRRLSTVR
ncbi:hypothetical protein [Deinococcus pimensis]|uniref:hypothetical protein n=1 Tax=Deinococcus pimensis TaxID=309888 RepID=UPI0004809EC5|nr:hypothetical protein [Deinococcus pimensis]